MALPINIEDLLSKKKVESNRIEFKASWNPDKIYHTICAFATDLENTGGGYILVGVEEENGIAKRPVKGLDEAEIDAILKDMVGYDAKIQPTYLTKVSPEEIDGKTILVIWVPAGANRPYSVMESVVAKGRSIPKYYVRSKSSTIEAKGEVLDEIRELVNRVPFDERGNEAVSIDDISGVRVYEYLKTVGSKLADEFGSKSLWAVLDGMDLLTGPAENRMIKNVAAMMFCENPEKFFPVTQVDIVHFPQGRIENPDVMIEVPRITGPVPKIIRETLSYLRTNVIKLRISKPVGSETSDKAYNYPYQALEEAVVNALYHRDYKVREPVEISIEPKGIDILSYSGPDRSISAQAIKEATILKARRYKNRRLGDFLKELGLTEGRATGIPTIQKHLQLNGSQTAVIETDEERTYFLITIPCRADMVENNKSKKVSLDENESQDTGVRIIVLDILSNIDLQVYLADRLSIDAFADKLEKLILQVCLQVWEKVRDRRFELIKDLVAVLLSLYEAPSSSNALLNRVTLGSLYKLRHHLLEPLSNGGYIALTEPEKRTSSKQRYCLTEKGRNLFYLQ